MRSLLVQRLAVAALVLCPTGTIAAQGSLSGLGFGYPVGGTSTRAGATSGAFGEFDALSPINPASLGGVTRTVLAVQTEPEFRTLRAGGVSEKTSAQRVPLLLLAFPVRPNVTVALSATTFLDRSFSTVTAGAVVIDGATITTTDQTDARGSIADVRTAAGWRVNDKFSVGFGAHMFTGDNLVARSRTFADSTRFGNVLDSSRVVYFGTALSVGGEWRMRKGWAAMMSYRAGGGVDARVRDTVKSSGRIPDRLGVGLRYDGIPGSIFAVGLDRQDWTAMRSLGSAAVQPRTALSWHGGAEVAGPKWRGSPLLVRTGFSRNQLPFGTGSSAVNESRISGGLGIPIARDQASVDFSVQRASRTLISGGAKESAWMIGVGLQLRP